MSASRIYETGGWLSHYAWQSSDGGGEPARRRERGEDGPPAKRHRPGPDSRVELGLTDMEGFSRVNTGAPCEAGQRRADYLCCTAAGRKQQQRRKTGRGIDRYAGKKTRHTLCNTHQRKPVRWKATDGTGMRGATPEAEKSEKWAGNMKRGKGAAGLGGVCLGTCSPAGGWC